MFKKNGKLVNAIYNKRKVVTALCAVAAIATVSISAIGQNISDDEWTVISKEFDKVVLAPGADDSQLKFSWYSLENQTPVVEMVESDKDFSEALVFSGTTSQAYKDTTNGNQYYSNKVTANNLESGKEYKYRYKVGDSEYSETYTYSCKDTSSSLQFIALGDPQIGIGTGGSKADTERWNNTLQLATATAPNAKFLYSMGDQVDGNQEYGQYAGFLNPDLLRKMPIATLQGNHDCDVPNFLWHFNNPNMTKYGETNAGGDYYFTSGDVLFISLNSNAVLKSSKSDNVIVVEHRKAIEEAIESNPYAKWRVITFHQDIYGYPDHFNDPEVSKCREQLSGIIDDYDIDVVLTGHGHNYTRSLQMEGGVAAETADEYYTSDVNVSNPSGTVYFELSTAASKNYENNKPGASEHIAKSFAVNGVQSYSVVTVDAGTFNIKTYRTDTNEVYDSYTINKDDRTKLDQSIAKAENIINSGKFTNEELTDLRAELAVAKNVSTECSRTEAYDAAVRLNLAISTLDTPLYGDINGDGEVAINDVILLKKYLAGLVTLTDEQLKAADVTHEGDVAINDAIKIQKFLAKTIDQLD